MVESGLITFVYLFVPAMTLVVQAVLAWWIYTKRGKQHGATAFLVMIVAGMVWMLGVMGHVFFVDRTVEYVTFVVWALSANVSIVSFGGWSDNKAAPYRVGVRNRLSADPRPGSCLF